MEAAAGELIPRVTRRCLTDDLGLPTDSIDLTIDELASANDVIAALRDRRGEQGATGQEPIRSLLPEVVAFRCTLVGDAERRGTTERPG